MAVLVSAVPGWAVEPQLETKLAPPNPETLDQYGFAVELGPDTAVVGDLYGNGVVANSGVVYVYGRAADGSWTQKARLAASDGASGNQFGFALDLAGDRLLVGAPGKPAAYVFERDAAGAWTQKAKLVGANPANPARFGAAVALDGDDAIIGALMAEAAFVFQRGANGVWTQQAKLVADDPHVFDFFGVAVGLAGDTAFVGAQNGDGVAVDSGKVYRFTQDAAGTWTRQAPLAPEAGEPTPHSFGVSLSLEDATLLVGGLGGRTYAFTRDADGDWAQAAALTGDHFDSLFGRSVALRGDRAAVGAPFGGDAGADAGAAYLFSRDAAGAWKQKARFTASDARAGDRLGIAVDVLGPLVLVGAYQRDEGADQAGAAYLFDLDANKPPVAVIAPVPELECANGRATATLDGTASFDPEGQAITFEWTAAGIVFDDAASPTPTAEFPFGETTVTLTVTDPYGASGEASTVVVVADHVPPVAGINRPVPGTVYVLDAPRAAVPGQSPLRPALAVGTLTVQATAQDACGVAGVTFASTAGPGAVDGAPPYQFRSDPPATASGAVTVTAMATDLGGNTAQASTEFVQVGAHA